MGSVTEDNQNLGRSKLFWKKQAVQKLEKELLELRLKYVADVSAVKENVNLFQGRGLKQDPKM